MRLLVVEDDPSLGPLLQRGLQEEGYPVDLAVHPDEADLYMAQHQYACVILDRRLPGRSGDELLQRWRRLGYTTPVLMLTALDRVEDRVLGLDLGADDYLGKPFAFDELLARIRALIRRGARGETAVRLQGPGGLAVDLGQRRITLDGRELPLTNREFRVAVVLLRNAGRTVARERLVEAVWDDPWDISDNALEAHVKNLRRKLAAHRAPVRIVTVRGIGYRLEERGG